MTDIVVHSRSGAHSVDQDQTECFNEVQRLNPSIYNRQDDEEDQQQEGENPQGGVEKDLFKLVTL